MLAHGSGDDVPKGKQRRAAMVVDHAFGVARGAGGVVQRDRVPLVLGHQPLVLGIPRGEERLIAEAADGFPCARIFRVVHVDHQGPRLRLAEGVCRDSRKLPVDDEHLGLAVVEAEGQRRCVEPGIEGVEHAPRHRHAVVALEHLGGVGQQYRHGVAAPDAARRQRRGEAPAAGVERAIAPAQPSVDDGGVIGKHPRRPVEIAQRRQRLIVGRVLVEIPVVDAVAGHRRASQARSLNPRVSARAARSIAGRL